MGDLLGVLGVGLLGSFHCLGMCGPIVLAYSLNIANPSQAGKKAARRSGSFRQRSEGWTARA